MPCRIGLIRRIRNVSFPTIPESSKNVRESACTNPFNCNLKSPLAEASVNPSAPMETVGNSPGELAAMVRSEIARMSKVIRDAGIRVQ